MNDLLTSSLAVAVPLWQHKLKDVPMDDLVQRVAEAGKMIAQDGEKLLYGSNVKGEVADLFNRTAEAIAILSFLPGGITIFGQHWEGTQREISHEQRTQLLVHQHDG